MGVSAAGLAVPCPLPLARGENITVSAFFGGREIVHRQLGRRPGEPRRFAIGHTRDVDAPIEPAHLGSPRHDLVVFEDDTPVVRLAGRLHVGELTADHHAVRALTVPAHGQVRISAGKMSFVVERTVAPEHVPRASPQRRRLAWKTAAGALAGVLVIGALIATLPPDPRSIAFDLLRRSHRFVPAVVRPSVPPSAPPSTATWDASGGRPTTGRIGGRATTSDQPLATGRLPPVRRARSGVPPAAQLGVLGVLAAAAQDGPLSSVFQRGSALAELNVDAIDSQVRGAGPEFGALVAAGTPGAGSGADGENLQPVGTFSRPPGRGEGTAALLGSRVPRSLQLIPDPPVVRGRLDRELVRRVVRQNLNQVRHCYERELVRTPELTGRLVVRFTIAPDGQVVAALPERPSARAALDGCVVQAVRRWRFPQVAGGGPVVVSYPFVFVSPGEP